MLIFVHFHSFFIHFLLGRIQPRAGPEGAGGEPRHHGQAHTEGEAAAGRQEEAPQEGEEQQQTKSNHHQRR